MHNSKLSPNKLIPHKTKYAKRSTHFYRNKNTHLVFMRKNIKFVWQIQYIIPIALLQPFFRMAMILDCAIIKATFSNNRKTPKYMNFHKYLGAFNNICCSDFSKNPRINNDPYFQHSVSSDSSFADDSAFSSAVSGASFITVSSVDSVTSVSSGVTDSSGVSSAV